MSALEIFAFGCLGGAIAYVMLVVLPYATDLMNDKATAPLTLKRCVGYGLVFVINVGLGGVAAFFVGDVTTSRQAVVLGTVWPSVLASIRNARNAAVTRGHMSADSADPANDVPEPDGEPEADDLPEAGDSPAGTTDGVLPSGVDEESR